MVGAEGPRLVAAVLHAVRRDAVGRHRAGRLPGDRRSSCSPARRYVAWTHVRPRPDPGRHLARPVGRPARQGLPDHPVAVRARRRRGRPAPGSASAARRRSPRPRTTSSSPPSARSSGLLGATAVLIAFLLLVGAGLRTALRTERPFEKLLAAGLTTIVGVQAFIIIGGVIKVVPLTGITLPFVSYGGSSLVANYVLLALLMRSVRLVGARRLGELPDDPTPGERWQAWRLPGRSAVRRARAGPSPSPAGRAVNRQIRQLAAGLDRAATSCCSSRSTTGRSGASRNSTRSSTTHARLLRDFNKPRGPIVTADGVSSPASVPDRRRRRQVPARVPDRRPPRPR